MLEIILIVGILVAILFDGGGWDDMPDDMYHERRD